MERTRPLALDYEGYILYSSTQNRREPFCSLLSGRLRGRRTAANDRRGAHRGERLRPGRQEIVKSYRISEATRVSLPCI